MKYLPAFLLVFTSTLLAGEGSSPNKKKVDAQVKDPFESMYSGYNPGFTFPKEISSKARKLSSESKFYTLTTLHESSRANALVAAAIQKETAGQFREALKIYQKVIDDHSNVMYRVCEFGVFVPITRYCQLRILKFPESALNYYRTKYDSKAKEAFELARKRNYLEGFTEIRDTMLCTSYGAPAMLMLGDMALDLGHYLAALEYYQAVQDYFPDKGLLTPELKLKLALCQKKLGNQAWAAKGKTEPGVLSKANLGKFSRYVSEAKFEKPAMDLQQSSAPHVAADDYMPMLPTTDPLGLEAPVWERAVKAKPMEGYVFTQPVVTDNSVIYRHKNIVFCRSLLNGELRWKNEMGGRVLWQNVRARQYPQEDILVQDGMVYTPMYKVGPTLVALEETTGQMKWAYGPMVATTPEQARMRFETAPAGGPMAVYAGYILDNIEGDTHTDSEYGVMAFDSLSGRVKWRTPICRMMPGLFAGGFATKFRNRIRSFLSPPLYYQGTLYYCTNAGAVAALDALSGKVKWLMKYPYDWWSWPGQSRAIHDATRQFGSGDRGAMTHTGTMAYPHAPMFWYNQRPLLIGDDLFLTPVDAPYLYRIDRRTGKVVWRKRKGPLGGRHINVGGCAYFMGATRSGDLLNVYSRSVELLDPKTGKVTWTLGSLVDPKTQPVLKYLFGGAGVGIWGLGMNSWRYMTSARPFLSSDNKLYIPGFHYHSWPFFSWTSHLAVVDLKKRKRLQTRHYISQKLIDRCAWSIEHADERRKPFEDIPHKNEKLKYQIKGLKEMAKDTIPENRYPKYLPFSRITVDRFGTRFEFRMSPSSVAMVFDKKKVRAALKERQDAGALFAQAELAVAEERLAESSALMKKCLDEIPPSDLDFRATVNQLLYKVHKRLARSGARSRRSKMELEHGLGMSRTAGTIADEIEASFVLADAWERKGDHAHAVKRLRSIVRRYAAYEYPVSALTLGNEVPIRTMSAKVLDGVSDFTAPALYGKEFKYVTALLKNGLEPYLGELTPVEKNGTMRAGDLAVSKMLKIKEAHPEFAGEFETQARAALAQKGSLEEKTGVLWAYPGTQVAQRLLEKLLADSQQRLQSKDLSLDDRALVLKRQWRLADTARICGLKLPAHFKAQLSGPSRTNAPVPIKASLANRETNLEEARGTSWLVLQRRGQRHVNPSLAFLGGRVKKKLDNKFVLYCMDTTTGSVAWKGEDKRGANWSGEIRLRGQGREPGFFDAFVYEKIVVVQGRYDVLAFHLDTGKLKWRYTVPFDFEIKHAFMSGNLFALAGDAETVVLHLDTQDPRGEVVWQEKEEGNLYAAPYFDGDRLVEVRKMPFNLTVRYRSTGKLIGRLALPDLTLHVDHPLLSNGPKAIPLAHEGNRLVLSDGFYYLMIDVERVKVIWKRLIDQNDMTREPPLRFALDGDYLAVLKENYDLKAIYMRRQRQMCIRDSILWKTDPKVPNSPRPMHSMYLRNGKLFGIQPHPGQGFYFVGLDAKTGKPLFEQYEQKGYGGKPDVSLTHEAFGDVLVARIRDRQDFELKAFRMDNGKLIHQLKLKAAGDFGIHGRVSATVQNGRLLLFGKNTLLTAGDKLARKKK